jgi:hypothetical protein
MLGLYLLLALILLARSENVQAAVAEAISQVDSFIVMAVYQLGRRADSRDVWAPARRATQLSAVDS